MSQTKPLEGGGGTLDIGRAITWHNIVKTSDGKMWKTDAKGGATVKFNLNMQKQSQGDAIGACKMDYGASLQRGYTMTQKDVGNIEFTGFFRATNACSNDGIFMRGPCNHHPGGSGCCEEYNYDVRVKPGPSGYAVFTKDHPGADTNFSAPGGKKTITPTIPIGQIFGIKYVHMILSRAPNPRVRIECWINFNGDKKTWTKVHSVEDYKGFNWGNSKAACNGDPYQVGAWRAPRMVVKWYGCSVDFNWWSMREIAPAGAVSFISRLPYDIPIQLPLVRAH